jgi:hypothetical protein
MMDIIGDDIENFRKERRREVRVHHTKKIQPVLADRRVFSFYYESFLGLTPSRHERNIH